MISIEDLSFGYGHQHLFSGLNTEFENGRIYGLLGKNGAGKTTLLNLVCGLLKSQTGICRVLGMESDSKDRRILENLFFIPESFYLPPITIDHYESLHAPFYKSYDREAFSGFLSELGLNRDQGLNTLSYGLKKRFLLAFGLATNSRILLLDEPTNGLDIPSKRIFRKLLAGSINKDRVFIIATHQIKEMDAIFDDLVFIDQGRILLNRSLADISQKLRFRNITDFSEAEGALYKEEIPGGYSVIESNESGEAGSVDLEFLFNGVMEASEDLLAVLDFSQEEKGE
jgi:ABC-2 type transport system ATP-binding protein